MNKLARTANVQPSQSEFLNHSTPTPPQPQGIPQGMPQGAPTPQMMQQNNLARMAMPQPQGAPQAPQGMPPQQMRPPMPQPQQGQPMPPQAPQGQPAPQASQHPKVNPQILAGDGEPFNGELKINGHSLPIKNGVAEENGKKIFASPNGEVLWDEQNNVLGSLDNNHNFVPVNAQLVAMLQQSGAIQNQQQAPS